MRKNYSKYVIVALALNVLFVLQGQQCPTIDLNLTASSTQPEIGENVNFNFDAFNFNGVNWSSQIDYGVSNYYTIAGSVGYDGNTIGLNHYQNIGAYNAVLTVVNNDNGCVYYDNIGIQSVIPTCPFVEYNLLNYDIYCFGEDVESSISISYDNGWTMQSVSWNHGNGVIDNNTNLSNTYLYPNPGIFNNSVIVEFIDGQSGTCISEGKFKSATTSHEVSLSTNIETRIMDNSASITLSPAPNIISPSDIHYSGSPSPFWNNGINYSYQLEVNSVILSQGTGLNLGQFLSTFSFSSGVNYITQFTIWYKDMVCPAKVKQTIYIDPDDPTPDVCDDICSSFKPQPNNNYWISAWVKEDFATQQLGYLKANIQLDFIDVNGVPTAVTPTINFYAEGEVIEGWQRIAGKFTVPPTAFDMDISLVNDHQTTTEVFFDDIRIHPFNGGMKSYVYDGETFWLTSELDDNNFATFYEYDKEGGLVRIKKETSKGIMTIQETRSNSIKKENISTP